MSELTLLQLRIVLSVHPAVTVCLLCTDLFEIQKCTSLVVQKFISMYTSFLILICVFSVSPFQNYQSISVSYTNGRAS